MRTDERSGFTLIELLIVIAIIGLISTITGVFLTGARVKARDNKRITDLKQLQKALELAYGQNGGYPVAAAAIDLGTDSYDVLCGKAAAVNFVADSAAANCDAGKIYMGLVPRYPTPPSGGEYQYSGSASAYCIQATLEASVPSVNLSAGTIIIDPTALKNGTCP